MMLVYVLLLPEKVEQNYGMSAGKDFSELLVVKKGENEFC
jgi:hypothetical protein